MVEGGALQVSVLGGWEREGGYKCMRGGGGRGGCVACVGGGVVPSAVGAVIIEEWLDSTPLLGTLTTGG